MPEATNCAISIALNESFCTSSRQSEFGVLFLPNSRIRNPFFPALFVLEAKKKLNCANGLIFCALRLQHRVSQIKNVLKGFNIFFCNRLPGHCV